MGLADYLILGNLPRIFLIPPPFFCFFPEVIPILLFFNPSFISFIALSVILILLILPTIGKYNSENYNN